MICFNKFGKLIHVERSLNIKNERLEHRDPHCQDVHQYGVGVRANIKKFKSAFSRAGIDANFKPIMREPIPKMKVILFLKQCHIKSHFIHLSLFLSIVAVILKPHFNIYILR